MPDRMTGGTSTGLGKTKKPRVVKGNKKSGSVNKVKSSKPRKSSGRIKRGGRYS